MVARASGSPVAKPTGCLVSGQAGLVFDGAGCVQEREEPKLLKKIAATVAIVGVLAGLGAFGALSIFKSTASVGGNTFTTGTVVISTLPTSVLITLDPMAPGDKVTEPLTVTNDGTLDLRYAVTSKTTEDLLAAQLDLTIKSGVTTCDNDGFDDPGGSVLYGPNDLGSMAGIDVFDDQPLAAAPATHSEVLCFQVELPSDTGDDGEDTYQGVTTTATFTFDAEQTVNNP
jgi:hypothetical protein